MHEEAEQTQKTIIGAPLFWLFSLMSWRHVGGMPNAKTQKNKKKNKKQKTKKRFKKNWKKKKK